MPGLRHALRGVGLALLLALPAAALAWLADVGAEGGTDDAVRVQVSAAGAVDGRLPFRSTGEGAITARVAFTLPEGGGRSLGPVAVPGCPRRGAGLGTGMGAAGAAFPRCAR